MKYSQVAFIAAVGSTLVSVSAHPLIEGAQKHISKTVTAAGGPEEVARKAGDIINLANQIHRRTVTDGGSSSSTSTDATTGGGAAAVAETKPHRDHKKNRKNSKEHKDKNHKHNRNRNHNHNQGAGSGEASRRRRRPHRLPQNTPGSTGSGSEGAASSNLNAQSTTSTSTSTSDSTASPASVRRSLNFGRQELSIRDLVDFDDELHARSPTEGDGNSVAPGDANSTPGGAAAGPHHRHQGHHGGEGAEAEPHRQHHHHSRPSEAGSLRRRIYDFGREDLVMRDLAELELGLHAREVVVAAAGEQGESGSGNIPPAAAAAGSTGETKPHRHHHRRPGQAADAETQGSSQHPYHHHQPHSEQPTTASSSTSTTTTSSDASHLVRRDLVGSEGDEQLVARLFSNIRENYRQIKAARLAAKTAKWQAKAGGGAAGGGAPGGGSSNSGDSSNSRRGLFEDGLSELDARGFEDDSSLTERSVTDLAKAVWHNHKQNKALRLQRQSQLDAGKAASMNTGSGGDGSSSQNGRRDFVDDDELEMRDFVDDESELVAREQAYAPHDPKLISREWFDELDTRGFEIEEMD